MRSMEVFWGGLECAIHCPAYGRLLREGLERAYRLTVEMERACGGKDSFVSFVQYWSWHVCLDEC